MPRNKLVSVPKFPVEIPHSFWEIKSEFTQEFFWSLQMTNCMRELRKSEFRQVDLCRVGAVSMHIRRSE